MYRARYGLRFLLHLRDLGMFGGAARLMIRSRGGHKQNVADGMGPYGTGDELAYFFQLVMFACHALQIVRAISCPRNANCAQA